LSINVEVIMVINIFSKKRVLSISVNFLLFLGLSFFENVQLYADFIPLFDHEPFEGSLKYPSKARATYLVKDMDPSEAQSRNGIIFTGEGESSIKMHKSEDMYNYVSKAWEVGDRFIEHVPSGESSAEEGIVIRFKYPINKFGLKIGLNSIYGDLSTWPEQVELRAYSAVGDLVGTVEMEEVNKGYDNFMLPYTLFGFETTSGPGVTAVVLDNGASEVPERIAYVYYEYKTPRPFKTILPQIAHGTVSGASIESDLTLFWDRSAHVTTFSPSGEILDAPILNEGTEFDLADAVNVREQRYLKSTTIPGLDDLTVGYVVAESDYPIDGQVVYRTTDAEGKVYEADIRGCVPETYLKIPFELNQAENLNAALAIVNPSDTVAEIEIHVNDDFHSYTEFWDPPLFTLQPGEQRALFMWELWDEMPSEDGNYILQLRSSVPFAAAAFYTRNWIVAGNLPVWSYKEGQAR
jgi:hypothetical protein